MSVKYSLTKRCNPKDKNEDKKFYAQSQGSGETTYDEMCAEISGRCTLTKADVSCAIEAILESFEHSLRKGEPIRLGQFGSFRVGLSSKGVEKEEDFTSSMITKRRILFRPGKLLTNMLKTLEFTQVPKLQKKAKKVKPTEAAKDKPVEDAKGKVEEGNNAEKLNS